MKKRLRTMFTTILILLFLSNASYSQALSNPSKKLKIAYNELKQYPNSKQKQIAYLNEFPQTKQRFIAIFQTDDFSQLYSTSHEFIDAFVKLSKYYPVEVIDKSINIGKDLVYDADAVSQLQHAIVDLGNQFTSIFEKKVNSLTQIQVSHLIRFLADVENHKGYKEYQQLIDALNNTQETKLANQFIKARTLRERNSHH